MWNIGKHSLLGESGEISDFQEILRYLDDLILNDNMWDDGNSLGPKEVHNYLTQVMYNRRNKFDPLWNSLVLGGVKNGKKYIDTVSMIGVNFEDVHVATGFGNHLACPILRDEWHENLTFEEGVKLLEKCMRVLLYCERSVVNKLQTLIMGNREGIDEQSNTNASVLVSILKVIDKYDLYGQVAYPKHHKQADVSDIYRLAAKTKLHTLHSTDCFFCSSFLCYLLPAISILLHFFNYSMHYIS